MKTTKPAKNPLLAALGIGLLSALLCAGLYRARPTLLGEIDHRFGDYRFELRGEAPAPSDVVIVAIDAQSIDALGRWPWSRTVISRLLDTIEAKGARVVAFDMVFSEPESARADGSLARSIERSGGAVLGYFFREQESAPDGEESLRQLERSAIKVRLGELRGEVPGFPHVEMNLPLIGAHARGFGFFNFPNPDTDGTFRRSQLVLAHRGELYPSLGVEAVTRFLSTEVVLKSSPGLGIEGLVLGRLFVPTSGSGQLIVDYYGPGGTVRAYPATDVMLGTIPPGALEDKLVFIGATETGIYDARAVPLDPSFPGVEIHATVAGNILEGRFLHQSHLTRGLDYILTLALPLMLVLGLVSVSRTLLGLGVFVLLLALHSLANYLLFTPFGLLASYLYPALSMSVAYVFFEGYRNLSAERRSRYLRKAFTSYVSPDVVSEMLQDPGRLRLGGEIREISILFSDIRGFTALSESIPPEELVLLLNEYLGPMTRIVLDKSGTLDKYIGDSIMAIFGAPAGLPGHPRMACESSLEMVRALGSLNEGWTRRGLPRISIGIGVNTGRAIVGNMGTDFRFDYTAIGEEVNLASRLEGLNKFYGTDIIITRSTLDGAGDGGFVVRELDLVRVKGIDRPAAIFELMDFDTAGSDKRELAGMFTAALVLYRKGDYHGAREGFGEIARLYPDDGPSAMYLERAAGFADSPPPDSWDGVYTPPE